jgi:putative oxidoreductase
MATYEWVRAGSRLEKNAALLPLRATLAATMAYHGLEKLKGEGPQKTAQMMEQIDIRPAKPAAIGLGLTEFLAGVSVLAGFATRPAALAVLASQSVAIWKVHGKKGFDFLKGGYEFNLALIAISLGLLVAGPGRYSAHEGFEHVFEGRGARKWLRKTRPGWGLRLLKWMK